MQLELNQIEINNGTQPRAVIDEGMVGEYADNLRAGANFPPVVVFHDGSTYWLADGFHRYHAHQRIGRKTIEVDLRPGSLRDALLHSVGANAEHGLRRNNADKRRAVATMLGNDLVARDEVGHPWSDRAIARRCAVSHTIVSKMRQELPNAPAGTQRSYINRHGTKAVMNTARIGCGVGAQMPHGFRIAKNALRPVRGFGGSGESEPVETISLPSQSPRLAACALISMYGKAYAQDVLHALERYFEEGSDDAA